jgi:hypothetical protein
VLLVVVVGLVQCNAVAVSIAFGPWLSAIQLKPVNLRVNALTLSKKQNICAGIKSWVHN